MESLHIISRRISIIFPFRGKMRSATSRAYYGAFCLCRSLIYKLINNKHKRKAKFNFFYTYQGENYKINNNL